jgi:MSHA biogenesis protein MshL
VSHRRFATRTLRPLLVLSVATALSCASPNDGARLAEAIELPPLVEIEPGTVSKPDASARPPALRLLEQTRFTLNVQDAELRGLLLGLGHDSPLDIVVGPGVTGTVTASLRDASLLEILDQIVVARGYRYRASGNLIKIYRPDRETRTYRIDYPSYAREANSDVLLSGLIGTAPEFAGDSGGSGKAEDSSMSSLKTVQVQDFWTEVEQALSMLVLGSAGVEDGTDSEEPGAGAGALSRRRVIVSRQAGLVTVTAEASMLEDVERYLDELASSLGRQVLIDASILEVSLGDELTLGVDLEIAPNYGDAAGVFARSIVPGLREATLVQSLAPILEEGGVSFGIASESVGVIIRALSKQTDVRVLSTPRLATLNNHAALIKVVRNEVFFIAEVKTEVVEGVGTTQTVEYVPKIIPVGVTLDVTPQVSNAGDVTLHVHPSVSEIVSLELQPQFDSSLEQAGSLPVIDLREADTVLRVPDGTTIVIGGLVQTSELERQRKIPLLGDIPLIGYLFRNSEIEERRRELLIFLTPTVLDPPRIAQITEDLLGDVDSADALRGERSLVWPWWRRPFGQGLGGTP